MATSFLPDTADASVQPTVAENIPQPVETLDPFMAEQDMTSIPETPMPLDALEGHPTEDEHFLEDQPVTGEPLPLGLTPSSPPPSTNSQKAIPQVRDDLAVQIEKIMEENLGDVFTALTPVQKQQFKIKGEETANKIRHIIETTKAKLGKIIKLIFEWLKILPGVNHFFLEQEAKIKAEKIIILADQKNHLP